MQTATPIKTIIFSKSELRYFFLLTFLFFCSVLHAQRQHVSLNNNWLTAISDNNPNAHDGFQTNGYKIDDWKKVNVPHNWDNYYGYRRLVHGNLHGTAWYKKTVSIRKQANKRYLLFFEGVGSYATVWVNGKEAGAHAGGRTTFTLDVTNLITNGLNTVSVKAGHPANIQNLPWVCGGCSDERGFSEGSQPMGIFRPVTLIIANETRITPFGIHAWADVKETDATLHIKTTIKSNSKLQQKITVTQKLLDANQKIIAATSSVYEINPSDSLTYTAKQVSIANPNLWSVDKPYLYSIVTSIIINNQLVDEVQTSFGFRTIQWRTASNQFLLNGKPVFINGVAEYEHLIGQSHAFSHQQIQSRVKWMQAAGFNAFRDGHQPHHLLYGQLFNQKGILWWTQLSAHVWYNTPEFKNNFKQLLKEWVIERRNDPSVILWGLQNESKLPQDFAKECTELIRSLDPTASSQRLVTTCNGGSGTDWDVPQNWTGTYGGNPGEYGVDLKKQVLVGEYGAWRTLDLHTEGGFQQNGPWSEDRFALLMEKKIRLAESVKDSVAGHFFWLLTSHDNPGRVQGGEGLRELDRIGPVNYKGMLTPWEEPTDVYYLYRSNYAPKLTQPMVYIASHTWPNRWMQTGIKDSIYVYSNCDEVELFNDIDNASLGRKKTGGIGTHFQWDNVNIRYNVLYAVGYINGKAVAKDTMVLLHLPPSPNFNKLYAGANDILKPQKGVNYIYRINCGGPDYKDDNGNIWMADKTRPGNLVDTLHNDQVAVSGFRQTLSWTKNFSELPENFASQRRAFAPVKGTKDWGLFQSFRYGKDQLEFNFPLPDGKYLVELYFMEPWIGIGGGIKGDGMRVFDVAFNNKTVLKDFDIWKEAGTNSVLKKIIPVTITNNKMLVIHFPKSNAGQAIISAIAIATNNRNASASYSLPHVALLQEPKNVAEIQSWLDIGDMVFKNADIRFHQLPPVLYGSEWLLRTKNNNGVLNFVTPYGADVYVGVDEKLGKPAMMNDFENTNAFIVTDENGGKRYTVYKKRFKPGETMNATNTRDWLVAMMFTSNMQPAYDLKPITSYTADVSIISHGVMKKNISGSYRNLITTDDSVEISWPVKTGVADIYAITLKYYSPQAEDVGGTIEMYDAGNNRMLKEPLIFKLTRQGKWNTATVYTPGMVNAGDYVVLIKTNSAKGLVLSNIDVQ